MNKKYTYLVLPVIIAIIGVGYMGYADSKGLNNIYGKLMIGSGVFLSFYNLLLRGNKAGNKSDS